MAPIKVTVATAYEDGLFTIGFADDVGGSALLVSRADEFDEQDVRLGMDTYCVSTQAGAAHYGGITAVTLTGPELRIELSREAADELGLDQSLTLLLGDNAAAVSADQGLRRLGVPVVEI